MSGFYLRRLLDRRVETEYFFELASRLNAAIEADDTELADDLLLDIADLEQNAPSQNVRLRCCRIRLDHRGFHARFGATVRGLLAASGLGLALFAASAADRNDERPWTLRPDQAIIMDVDLDYDVDTSFG